MFLGSDALAVGPVHQPRSPIWRKATTSPSTTTSAQIFDAAGEPVERRGPHRRRLRRAGREGQLPPLHGKGDPRPAGGLPAHHRRPMSTRSTDRAAMPGGVDFAKLERIQIVACGTAYIRRPARQVPVRAAGRPARATSRSPRSSATASRRCSAGHAGHRPCRSRARPPTPWRRCAGARPRACRPPPWSTPTNRPWPARSTWSGRSTAGPEIGVASTKAFTAQVGVLTALAVAAARARGRIDDGRGGAAGAACCWRRRG